MLIPTRRRERAGRMVSARCQSKGFGRPIQGSLARFAIESDVYIVLTFLLKHVTRTEGMRRP
jgi:hypothetical protein